MGRSPFCGEARKSEDRVMEGYNESEDPARSLRWNYDPLGRLVSAETRAEPQLVNRVGWTYGASCDSSRKGLGFWPSALIKDGGFFLAINQSEAYDRSGRVDVKHMLFRIFAPAAACVVTYCGGILAVWGFMIWLGYNQKEAFLRETFAYPLILFADLVGCGVFFLLTLLVFRRRLLASPAVFLAIVAVLAGLSVLSLPVDFPPNGVVSYWLQGFEWRLRGNLDVEKAGKWAEETVKAVENGTLRLQRKAPYFAVSKWMIEPERVPRFLTTPWVIRPIAGIVTEKAYVKKKCIALSWYGYHVIFGEPAKALLERRRELPIRFVSEDLFILYDSHK